MAASTEAFFDELAERGHEPLLEKVSGSLRFDAVDGKKTERWLVTVAKGDIRVSRQNRRADAEIRLPRTLLDELVRGEANALSALLRGAVDVAGDVSLLVLFQRFLPGPPSAHGPLFGLVQKAVQR